MKNQNDSNFKVMRISLSKYNEFCMKLESEISITPDFEVFKDKSSCNLITQISGEIFTQEIHEIILLLDDINVAISAFDIPESTRFNKEFNNVYGVAVMIGIFNNIGRSNIDHINDMPFSLHKASHSNGKRLESTGLDGYTPEVKLGFHNDGLISQEKIEIPKHIALYNLYISYHKPGNFMWIPTAVWDDSEKYGVSTSNNNISVKIKLSPIFHLDKNNEIVNSGFNYVTAPVSSINKDGQLRFFINGQVLPEDNEPNHVDFVQSIRHSLQNNLKKIYIPQKERRAIFLRNTMGFHARDIFEEPIEGVDLSRVLLRSVDLNSELYPST